MAKKRPRQAQKKVGPAVPGRQDSRSSVRRWGIDPGLPSAQPLLDQYSNGVWLRRWCRSSENPAVVTSVREGNQQQKQTSIPGQARRHHRFPALHPTRFRRTLASLFPAATHSHFVTRPGGAAYHPRVRLHSPSRVPMRHRKARVRQLANRTRRVARAIWTLLPHRHVVAHPLQQSLPLRPYQVLRCTRHAHAPTPSSCGRWPPTPFDSSKSCFPYTGGRPYGHEATTNVRGTPSADASEHRLGSLAGV